MEAPRGNPDDAGGRLPGPLLPGRVSAPAGGTSLTGAPVQVATHRVLVAHPLAGARVGGAGRSGPEAGAAPRWSRERARRSGAQPGALMK